MNESKTEFFDTERKFICIIGNEWKYVELLKQGISKLLFCMDNMESVFECIYL